MSKKLQSPSIFIGKQGKGILSFGSGQPDLPPPAQVFEVLKNYHQFKYGLIHGQDNLRAALAKQYPKSTPESFMVTNGASEALDLTLRVIGRNGNKKNKVLLPKPYYYSYPPMVEYAGMENLYTELDKGKIVFDDFEKKVHECKAVIINSPSNPTGRVESIKTLKQIEKITKGLGVYVISDEVYKDIIYTRENYLIKGPHVVTVNSFSKTFAMTGFRIGYLWSLDKGLISNIKEMKTHTSMNTSIIGQEMAYGATKVPKSYIRSQLKIWKERRDIIYEGFVNLGFDLWKPEGAFYVLPKVRNPRKFLWDMYKKHNVITYLGEWFGAPKRIRFSYALDKEKIEEGLKRIKRYIKQKK